MIRRFITTKTLLLALLAVLTAASTAPAQDMETLLAQLRGKADAPTRSAAQLKTAYLKAIDHLLPLMSAEDVGSRYAHQIALQDMGSHASRLGAELERKTLAEAMIATLDSAEMPDTVRHWFVLQLERIGKGESVPALAKLMFAEDAHLRDYARRALEQNPDPGATDALLEELARADDATWKIGLINALGRRGATKAVEPIGKALTDADPRVGAAAVTALGNIGGVESGRALIGVLNRPQDPIARKAATALVDIAQNLVGEGLYSDAADIYRFLYQGAKQRSREPDNPFNIRAAALNGMAIASQQELNRLIVEIIKDNDPKIRSFAVQAARLAPTKAPLEALCGVLADLEPYYQVQVLGLLADRGDLSSTKYAKAMLASDDEAVRLAAIDVLRVIGSDEGVAALMGIAVDGSGRTQKAALRALALTTGPRVDEWIADQAASGEADVRSVAIGLLSQRRLPRATETLLGYAAEGDAQTRSAAFEALVDVADLVDVAELAPLVVKAESRSVRRDGAAALRAVFARASDKDATAEVIASQMKAADIDAKVTLLTCLDALGGKVALGIVVDAARSSDKTLRDAAVRTLSNWPDFDAAESLLGIASKSETSLTHYVLATRGALRLIATSQSAPMDDRVTLCFYAFDNARRVNEKKQAVSAMGALPNKKVAARLLELAKDDQVKIEAGLAAVELASKTLRSDRKAAQGFAKKVRELNISDEVNRRADAVIRGRRR